MEALPGLMFAVIGLCVMLPFLLICGTGMYFCFRGLKQTEKRSAELRDTKLVDIKKLKKGLQKIEGTIHGHEKSLRSPLSKKKCVYYRFVVQELRSHNTGRHRSSTWVNIVDDKEGIDVTIEDGTGEVEIDLNEAEVTLTTKNFTRSGSFNDAPPELENLLRTRYGKSSKGWLFNKSMRYIETYLRDGDTVLVIGDVQIPKGENPEFYRGEHHLMITDMEESKVGSMYTGRKVMYWIGIGVCGFMMLMACLSGGIFMVVGGGMGVLMGKMEDFKPPEIKPGEIKPPDFKPPQPIEQPKNVTKPRPINPTWIDAKMIQTFLNDMKEENPKLGWGKFGKNGMLGYGTAFGRNDDPVSFRGKPDPKAISFHPPDFGESSVQYRLNRQQKLFKAKISLQDFPPGVDKAESPQTYKIYGDGELLWVSNPIQNRLDTQDIRISVENVDLLELRVHCGGGKRHAWSIWLSPHLLR